MMSLHNILYMSITILVNINICRNKRQDIQICKELNLFLKLRNVVVRQSCGPHNWHSFSNNSSKTQEKSLTKLQKFSPLFFYDKTDTISPENIRL